MPTAASVDSYLPSHWVCEV